MVTEEFQKLLQQMDLSLLQGYKNFMHEVIIQALSHHDFTLDALKGCLFDFNKEVMHEIVQKAISYYEMYAPPKIKSYGR